MQQAGPSDWHSAAPTGVSLSGFTFSYRGGALEWRLLHGIDPDAVVKLTDVRAIEDCLPTLQQGNLEHEKALSSKNCIQLFRLLQLAIEYVWHLRNAHTSLLEAYGAAVAAAGRWKTIAEQFLDTGAVFVNSCLSSGDIQLHELDQVDLALGRMGQADRQYNDALNRLEDEDQRARYFHFRKQRTELNWQQLCSVDLDALTANTDTQQLERVLPSLVFGNITAEDRDELTPHHFTQLIPLAQAALDYMMFQANATGAALERSMVALQAACMEIPALTTATQQLHTRMSNFILDAQSQAAQLNTNLTQPPTVMHMMQPNPMMGHPGAAMHHPQQFHHMQHVAAMPHHVQHMGMVSPVMVSMDQDATMVMHAPQMGSMAGRGLVGQGQGLQQRSPQKQQQQQGMGSRGVGPQMASSAFAGYAGSKSQAPMTALRPMLYRMYSAVSGGTLQQPGSPGSAASTLIPAMWQSATNATQSSLGTYGEALALAATSTASAPALEMQAKAVEMHFRMETLESDLRLERSKAEEMRRMLADIRDRVVASPATPSGSAHAQSSGTFTEAQMHMYLQGTAGMPPMAKARGPSMPEADLLRAVASADVGGRWPPAAEMRAKAAKQRLRGHRATQSQAQAGMLGDLITDGDDLLDSHGGALGVSPLGPTPSSSMAGVAPGTERMPGVRQGANPAAMSKGRMGGRGMHRRTVSTSKSISNPGGPDNRGGAQTPPNHSRQPSATNLGLSGDLDDTFAQGHV